jgi:hypothetical protein
MIRESVNCSNVELFAKNFAKTPQNSKKVRIFPENENEYLRIRNENFRYRTEPSLAVVTIYI